MTQESALIFPFLNKSDSGTYGCTATSNMGSYTAYFTLNVNGESPWLLTFYIFLLGQCLALDDKPLRYVVVEWMENGHYWKLRHFGPRNV